ncbi:MFS transporter [Chlamydia pecorum]|uniref:MFS transporter n=1 Tax=Chlamydia pecorum TaxID=85991 RepID=UPI0003AD96A2|nr:MFS transporter [Chlamydia pecorum]AGW38443.1 putative membrane protein [Chlamydia pecorum W73]AGW39368.1 putative membrane protein [Chlamydia pecorum P787]ETF39173.1 efflux protein [Chlamydia pecorum DBDeUG]ETF39848.1 efflux protein [Chlamydia pecorum MC/MarsBar]ETF40899.1 efflux protein [Chlamydia pecorum IPTaLE]
MNVSIRKKSFRALVITHFLTIINDNLYKFLLVFFLLEGKTLAENAKVLSFVSFFFALPFLLLAPLAGSLADRYQKRNIILVTRVIEIFCTVFGAYFFYVQSVFGGYVVLIFMACHTAIFGPAKMGILPEMLPLDQLSKANGIMTAATYTGSILGSCFAPLLVDFMHHFEVNNYVWPAMLGVISSIISTGIAFRIRSSNIKNRHQKIVCVNFKDLWQILKDTRQVHYLTVSIVLVAFFLLVGAYTQVEIISFVEFTLNYPKHYGGYLFPLVALGVGCGSYITGWISGKDIKLGYTPLAAIGISLVFMGLAVSAVSLVFVMMFLLLLGFLGGIYQVPLHAYVQYASPEHKRGQILAANNFLDFFGVLVAAVIVRVLGCGLRLSPEKSFFFMGWLVLFVGVWTLWIWKEHVYRLLLATVLRKQLGSFLKLPSSLQPECYFTEARSYQEVRRILALFPKTMRCMVFVLDQKLQPGWTTRLISYCVPTAISPTKNSKTSSQKAWEITQAEYIQTALQKLPSLCVICLGSPESSQEFISTLSMQGMELKHIELAQNETKRKKKYFLSLKSS